MNLPNLIQADNVATILESALDATKGLLRLTPTWEVFITYEAATAGVQITNTGSEPLEGLRYFGPDTFDRVPDVGDYKKQ